MPLFFPTTCRLEYICNGNARLLFAMPEACFREAALSRECSIYNAFIYLLRSLVYPTMMDYVNSFNITGFNFSTAIFLWLYVVFSSCVSSSWL